MENINRDRDKILKQKQDQEKEWENVKRKSNKAIVASDGEDNQQNKEEKENNNDSDEKMENCDNIIESDSYIKACIENIKKGKIHKRFK